MGEWICAGDDDTRIAFLCNSLFSYSRKGSEIGLSILRSCIYGDLRMGEFEPDADHDILEQGITEGYGDNEHFAPNVTCDRAQVATFLHRAEGKPAVNNGANPFIDIKAGTWYTEAVLWAAENDITVGYGEANTFRPELTCTRAQIVTFLYRAYK